MYKVPLLLYNTSIVPVYKCITYTERDLWYNLIRNVVGWCALLNDEH